MFSLRPAGPSCQAPSCHRARRPTAAEYQELLRRGDSTASAAPALDSPVNSMKRTGPRHGDRTSGSSEIVAIEKRVAVTERMDQPSASSGKPTPVVIQPQLRL